MKKNAAGLVREGVMLDRQMELLFLYEARDSRKSVEASVKTEDLRDLMFFHDGQVDRIACGDAGMPQDDLFGSLSGGAVDSKHFIGNSKQSVKRRLYRFASIDGHVSMHDFLKHLSVCHQALALADGLLKKPSRVGLVGMGRANQIHWDIGVDEDHGRARPR